MSALEGSTTLPQMDQPASAAPALSESSLAGDGGGLAKDKKKPKHFLGKKIPPFQPDLDQDGATGRTMSPSMLPSPPLTMSPSDRRPSPQGSPLMRPIGASPNRRIRSSSPGLHSPASSLIFERNVQEPEPSADVPAHIKTEDYIPPALDASSLAITDDHLNPDEVEIVMHSAHQPASAAVAGSMSDSVYSPSLAHEDAAASSHADLAEPASDYGSLDLTDPRRLSFISFADVVQAEHVEQDRQEMLGTASGEALQTMANRSPSPVVSPAGAHGLSGSPPRSGAASPSSPTVPAAAETHGLGLGVEAPLQIETMRQALRKTHSGDLSGLRSQTLSTASLEETADRAPVK